MVVLFLVYVGGLSNLSGKSYEELISKSPIVITGFMICTANLYVWYVLKHFLKDLAVPQHVESIRVNLLLMTIGPVSYTHLDVYKRQELQCADDQINITDIALVNGKEGFLGDDVDFRYLSTELSTQQISGSHTAVSNQYGCLLYTSREQSSSQKALIIRH